MSKIASEVLIERLADWGVDTIFGLPGDGINGIMEGLRRHQDRVRFVLVHHEEAAAFMATGYAKSTGKLGVCLATSGPGAIHLLNGLYDAKLDHAPVLAITGMQESQMLGTGYQQEVALEKLFIDVAEYNEMIHVPAQLPTLVDIAIRHAFARRGVAHLTIPTDIQIADAGANPWSAPAPAVNLPTAPIYLPASGLPRPEDVTAAAEVLNAGSKVVMLVGAGALGARREVLETAARLASPIVKTLPGKAVVPDDHPLSVGGLGLLGTAPAMDAMEGCDTLLMVGTNFPYTKYLPEPGQCKVVQIEADPSRAGNRIATDVPMIAGAAEGLRALLPLLAERADRSFLNEISEAMDDWRTKLRAIESINGDPIQPQYLMAVIDRLADDDAMLTSDSGTIATWAARHFTIRAQREFYLSGNLATMAPGLPYTIANQFAYPNRQCIAFVGDGGFAMLMAEFDTACRYGLPIKVVINNNSSLGQILWEQMVLGYPEHGVRFDRPSDFAPWAEACGARGIKVEKAGDVETAVEEAFRYPGPALVDVHVNPDEPPMPAKVEYEQAKGFLRAFLAGQPRKATIASTLWRDKITEFRA
ncbi:MAG TPA: thiamine pyrophosphate-dependent enzyme [Acidimicrobiales bacterium]|jgi:pyruvate dehydrogenase (quinone)/pyruvate oxidase|nr:thiamine pyrophosphate-dependent enzyme [Acidimicrobiales bacterium]